MKQKKFLHYANNICIFSFFTFLQARKFTSLYFLAQIFDFIKINQIRQNHLACTGANSIGKKKNESNKKTSRMRGCSHNPQSLLSLRVQERLSLFTFSFSLPLSLPIFNSILRVYTYPLLLSLYYSFFFFVSTPFLFSPPDAQWPRTLLLISRDEGRTLLAILGLVLRLMGSLGERILVPRTMPERQTERIKSLCFLCQNVSLKSSSSINFTKLSELQNKLCLKMIFFSWKIFIQYLRNFTIFYPKTLLKIPSFFTKIFSFCLVPKMFLTKYYNRYELVQFLFKFLSPLSSLLSFLSPLVHW